MKNRWMGMGLCVLAIAALIAPLAASGQKLTRVEEVTLDELERMQEKLARELARVERLLESKLVGIEERIPSVRAEQLRALEQLKLGAFNLDEIQARAHAAEFAARELGAVGLEGAQERVREAEVFARAAAEAAAEQGSVVWAGGSEDGWLGVSVDDVTSEKAKELKLAAERGVLVDDVDTDSPAAKAGLKKGDVITHFGGQSVEGVVQFRRYVRETPPGRVVQLTVWREGRSQQISATIGDFSEQIRHRIRGRVATVVPRDTWRDFGQNFSYNFRVPDTQVYTFNARPTLGIRTEDLDGQLGAYFGAPNNEGVLVTHVNTGSPAEKAGMKAGDVIVKVDGGRVRDTSDLRERMRDAREKKTVPVAVIRKGAETTVNVDIEQPKPAERPRITRRINL